MLKTDENNLRLTQVNNFIISTARLCSDKHVIETIVFRVEDNALYSYSIEVESRRFRFEDDDEEDVALRCAMMYHETCTLRCLRQSL